MAARGEVSLSNSQALRLKIELAAPHLGEVARRFVTHPRLPALVPEYLFNLYWSMQATVPLLRAAEARARALMAEDEVARQLVPYYVQHAREELHHDEWMLEDMAAIGIPRQSVLGRTPPAEVAAMIGSQYFWIEHAHPVALLGCFAVLEGSPMNKEEVEQFGRRARLPRAALRTLLKHAQLDPHHRDDLDRLVDTLPLTPSHRELLGLSALSAVDHLGRVLERILSTAPAGRTGRKRVTGITDRARRVG